MIQFHYGPDGHRLQVGLAGVLRAASGATMVVGDGWFVSADMVGVYLFSDPYDETTAPPPAAGFEHAGWDFVDGEVVRLVAPIAPKKLTAAQLDRFLRDDVTLPPGALLALYEAAIPYLESLPTQAQRFPASVARRGIEYTFAETLALAQGVAAAQEPPITLNVAALREAWDAAAELTVSA